MKVLVIGGMHGNEPLGLGVVALLKEKPLQQVDTEIGNPEAVSANVRFTSVDLNRSFPGTRDGSYEEQRAAALIERSKGYDMVLDFHNTHCPNNDCTFVGETASPLLSAVSSFFGLKRVITAPYDCINKYAPNCVSVEISLASTLNDPQLWYEKIKTLSEMDELPIAQDLERYRFAYRMTLEDKATYDLMSRNLEAFKPLPQDLVAAFGLTSQGYPIFINDAYTPYNFGGVVIEETNTLQ